MIKLKNVTFDLDVILHVNNSIYMKLENNER